MPKTRSFRYADLAIVPPHPQYPKSTRPWATSHSLAWLKASGSAQPTHHQRWSDDWHLDRITCPEHRRDEMIPAGNAWALRPWYAAGHHPRWSLVEALIEQKQRYGEIQAHINGWRRVRENDLVAALKAHPTRAAFLRAFRPHLWVWLYTQGRRYRVRHAFAVQYRANSFTAQQWLDTPNHEERRLMLRHGVEPEDITAQLGKPVAADAEGILYELGGQRWLAVQCPTTHERYLLAVPSQNWDLTTRARIVLDTPAKARRWTFGLPMDATFAAEA